MSGGRRGGQEGREQDPDSFHWFLPRFVLPDEGIDLRQIINTFENDILLQALSRTRGNKNKASELLKMNRTTLVEKLKKKNLQFEV